MPVSVFFNNYQNKQEQNLIEDLMTEAINLQGFNGYYISNSNAVARDLLFGDDPLKKFENAYVVAAYLSNAVDPGMNNDFFSKFGLEIKNSVRVLVARREFAKQVTRRCILSRPLEGDLFYIPFLSGNGELYEIKFVNDAMDNFMLWREQPYYWELELELFKYSNEPIITGIEHIDEPNKVEAYAIEYNLGTGIGDYTLGEIAYQGLALNSANAFGTVHRWNSIRKELKLTTIVGEFSNTDIIIGATSNAKYNLVTYDPIHDSQRESAWDNEVIADEISPYLDKSESNPFGEGIGK